MLCITSYFYYTRLKEFANKPFPKTGKHAIRCSSLLRDCSEAGGKIIITESTIEFNKTKTTLSRLCFFCHCL